MKAALEALPSIDQVNVRREDLGTGHRWEITFTKALGNLPELVAHMHRSEIQHVRTLGGDPTPLGGSFSLSYGGAATQALAHDASAASVKAALEALPTLDYVDVARDIYNFGQYRWRVTFRSEVLLCGLQLVSSFFSLYFLLCFLIAFKCTCIFTQTLYLFLFVCFLPTAIRWATYQCWWLTLACSPAVTHGLR